ncbi:ACT domain-containing protein ACR4-like [Phalaenopsis equestris]|uniref:ACT domain-containing protein ACR4-like n=1 Tax=Phalaenopsis equestris TaxID=78828 RepID=UPI0009E1B832|nr:ACT domain-containing protein ACR4-like [Phalaenopsis equestris]
MESGELWSYNGHVACILYLKEQSTCQPIIDSIRCNSLAEHLASVLRMQHSPNELWKVTLKGSTACRIHTERRLHQLMDMYTFTDVASRFQSVNDDQISMPTIMADKRSFESVSEDNKEVCLPHVSVESWKDVNYIVVKVRSSDRPKLMFDVVCALTDLDYNIFHGSIISQDSVAYQEYFVRRTNGYKMLNEMEKQSIMQSLTGAIERRKSRGLKMKVRKLDRHGLLSNVTMTLRENNLSLEKMKFTSEDGLAVGYFHISDASSSTNADEIDQQRLEAVCHEIGRGVYFKKENNECITSSSAPKKNVFSFIRSLGRSLWFHIKRFFTNFKFVR